MDKVTEIIIVPKYDNSPNMSISSIVEFLRSALGVVNLINNEFTATHPVILFNGELSNEARNQCAKFVMAEGYALVSFTADKSTLMINNESL